MVCERLNCFVCPLGALKMRHLIRFDKSIYLLLGQQGLSRGVFDQARAERAMQCTPGWNVSISGCHNCTLICLLAVQAKMRC